jgi:hypothetical protein
MARLGVRPKKVTQRPGLIDQYFALLDEVMDSFGYREDWRILPLDDSRWYFWRLYGEGPGFVRFADTEAMLDDPGLNYYQDAIYTQRHLPKWVYRGKYYTTVCVDTHEDGNQLLRIFDNTKERHSVGVSRTEAAPLKASWMRSHAGRPRVGMVGRRPHP